MLSCPVVVVVFLPASSAVYWAWQMPVVRLHMALLLALLFLSAVHQMLRYRVLLYRLMIALALALLAWDFLTLLVPAVLAPRMTRPAAALLLALDAASLLLVAGIQYAGQAAEENRRAISSLNHSKYHFSTL